MKKRQANFEILRVVAMAMIVAMHYMNRGNILQPLTENMTVANCVAWLLESFCIVAANCYVLISGYFLVESEWKAKKLWTLILEIVFYSLLIPAVCLIIDAGSVREWSVYDWITAVLPLQMDHYWFATAYVLLFALTPVLAAGVKQLSKKQLKTVIAVLLIYYCIIKTFCPLPLATDRYGYDFPWFICLFLVAAYIRLYGEKEKGIIIGKIHLFENGKNSLCCYVAASLLIFALSIVLGILNRKLGALQYSMDMLYSYNHFLTLFASVSLFYAFRYWHPGEGKTVSFLCRVAPYTFAVYLLHENIAVRNLWTGWFGVEKVKETVLFVPHMLLTILVVMSVGIVIDCVRKKIFSMILK